MDSQHNFNPGSWDGSIRLWKIDAKVKLFSLVGTISASGVVNSLQLLAAPKDFTSVIRWTSTSEGESVINAANGKKSAFPVLLVAGMGQEHRFGRWIKIGKESKGMNGAIVTLLQPRRTSP